MAQQRVYYDTYVCDIDGNEIPEAQAADANRKFIVNGTTYEIDLCAKDRTAYDRAQTQISRLLKPYVERARKDTKTRARRQSAASSSAAGERADIRVWARKNGWPRLGSRGRIPAEAVVAYKSRKR